AAAPVATAAGVVPVGAGATVTGHIRWMAEPRTSARYNRRRGWVVVDAGPEYPIHQGSLEVDAEGGLKDAYVVLTGGPTHPQEPTERIAVLIGDVGIEPRNQVVSPHAVLAMTNSTDGNHSLRGEAEHPFRDSVAGRSLIRSAPGLLQQLGAHSNY